MTETDDLTALRSAVARLNQAEKLALATYLTGTSNPKFQGLVTPDMDKLTVELAEACELSAIFPTDTRIFFAIELLELQIDRDEFEEEDGELWGPTEDPSITRAIAEVNSPEAQEESAPTVSDGDTGPYSCTPAIDQDDEDDSGLSGSFDDDDGDDGESYTLSEEEEDFERIERSNRAAWCLQDGSYPGDEEDY